MELELSSLPKTWLIDIDGTILKHNGYINDTEEVLKGVVNFFSNLPKNDVIILLTARQNSVLDETKKFLIDNGVRFDKIICGMPFGERILINDIKPSGLKTAYAINVERDKGFIELSLNINKEL